MIGQTLGHYRIVEKIGEGGMGVVYRARDERLDRDVALKLLPAGMLADSAALKSFREEAQALSKLNHPNIATVHDFDVQDKTSFLVMEYIPGISLDQKVAAGAVPEKEVIRLGTQLAQGLQAAHSKGIVHRDLKPSNLRVTPDCRLKILDFGLALFSEATDQNATETSLDLRPQAGTLPYMAPEQLQGQSADQRSDIYAAGAVLYEMTTGQRLFPDKHGTRLVEAILHRSPQPPRDLNPRVSPELQGIIQKALDKDPERRYQSARELQVDLQRISISKNPAQSAFVAEPTGPLPLEMAHILFMDIAAYSKLPMDLQKRLLEELQKSVRATREFVRAKSYDKLISLPSGDGMALVFFTDPESPCRCALEVSRLIRSHPEIKLRMGIHTGPVYRMADINANRNVAGGGINMAQRVMDCGDAGHILISQVVADVLSQISGWDGSLHDLGEAQVKHGARIRLFNLYTDDAGNPKLPEKLAGKRPAHKPDPGKRVRSSARSGVRPKNRSGTKTAAEIRAESTPEKLNEASSPQPEPGLLGKLHAAPGKRLAFVLLAVLLLAVLALALPLVPHKVKAAPPGVPPLAAGKFLAVLPFAIEGDTTTLQPIAEGLNQQLSAKLLALRDLSVTSARAAEDIDPRASLVTIGSSLGSNLVIRGTVRGDDKTIRIAVNLDEVASGRRRFSQTFSGTRRDLLALQDQVYARILKDLELKPSAKETERAAVRPTENPQAYDVYNKGRSLYRGHPDVNQMTTAISRYEEAIKIDPNFALARASLADASLWMYRQTKDVTWISKATAAAEIAQKLDGNLREAHLSLGSVYRATGKTDAAIKEFIDASRLSPGSDDCYRRLGLAYLEE
jgi:serine/threonine protein kinase/TolB-like protein